MIGTIMISFVDDLIMEKYLNEAFAYIHFHFGAWGSLGGICIYFHQKWSVVDSRQYVWVFFFLYFTTMLISGFAFLFFHST